MLPFSGSYMARCRKQASQCMATWFFCPFLDACETLRPFHNAATLRIYHCKRFAYHTLSGTWMQRVRIIASCSQLVVSQISRWSTTLCIGNEIILYFICRTSESELIAPFEASIKKHGRVEVVWICHLDWLLRLLRCWAFRAGQAREALSMS